MRTVKSFGLGGELSVKGNTDPDDEGRWLVQLSIDPASEFKHVWIYPEEAIDLAETILKEAFGNPDGTNGDLIQKLVEFFNGNAKKLSRLGVEFFR